MAAMKSIRGVKTPFAKSISMKMGTAKPSKGRTSSRGGSRSGGRGGK